MYVYAAQISQQERVISGAFAFGMHLLFLALLIFGVTWQKNVEPQANIVDLWSSLPSQAQPKAEPPPPPPEPVVRPVEPPPPKAAAKPEVAKPDIALKEKAEKERRILEEKQKAAKKREDEAKAAQKQQQAKQAEAQRLAQEQQDEMKKLAQQQAARQSQIDQYRKAISDKIRRLIVLPPNMQGNPEAEFSVRLLPDGKVMLGVGVTLKRSSGNAAYDNAVERAILGAQPLPVPPDPVMFREFRELNLKFRPQE